MTTRHTQTTVLITGNTYPVRMQLRFLGARWDVATNGWRVAPDKADQARELVASATPAGDQ